MSLYDFRSQKQLALFLHQIPFWYLCSSTCKNLGKRYFFRSPYEKECSSPVLHFKGTSMSALSGQSTQTLSHLMMWKPKKGSYKEVSVGHGFPCILPLHSHVPQVEQQFFLR